MEKKDGETKEEIVRARVIARDYANGRLRAVELDNFVFVSATESDIGL